MPEIRLELSPEDARKLDTEVDLLGFADLEEYLRWIIGNRAAIEQGTERDKLLTEYQARVDELESQLATGDASAASDAAGGERERTDADGADSGGASGAGSGDAGGAEERAVGSESRPASADGGTRTATDAAGSNEPASAAVAGTDGSASTAGTDGPASADAAGTASETVATDDDAFGDDGETGSGTSGATSRASTLDDDRWRDEDADATESATHAGDDESTDDDGGSSGIGGNFAPERVERFEDESLGSQANQLRGVEGERLDEFARRAVAKTRERLGREPATGLDYQSGTRISRSSPDVRPGEDLVDLDELDVPGRSAETRAPRQEAVGAAVAFLRDVDRAQRSDFVDALYDEYPADYDSESSWWRCIKRGLKDARVVDGGDGSRVWRYRPPGSREGELVGAGPKRIVDPE